MQSNSKITHHAELFKSFFSGKSETPESEKQKNDQKNFEIFKYDGLRAQRMGRPDYAVKCFIEALAIKEEFETMGYLSQLYIQMGKRQRPASYWKRWLLWNLTSQALS